MVSTDQWFTLVLSQCLNNHKACSESGSTVPLVIRGEDFDDSRQIAAHTERQLHTSYHIRNLRGKWLRTDEIN